MINVIRQLSAATKPLTPPALALRQVTSKTGKGVYASSDTLFKGAVFGRDSIEVAEDLLEYKPRLVKRIILTLASLQGEVYDDKSEEEPGRIIHEYRTSVVDKKPLKGTQKHIFDELSERWGHSKSEVTYYGSVDATPHFIRLVDRYTNRYGNKILTEKVRLRSGHELTVKLVVENAVEWLRNRIFESRSGLLEYYRKNPYGLMNQVWKDSDEFYIHEDGQNANHGQPISSIEVQGLVYDALKAAARLLSDKSYEQLADSVRDTVIGMLWLPERGYFALGTDYSKQGDLRIIRTLTANPAALLDTAIFDDLPDSERIKFVGSLIKKIMSPDFLTDAGIRSRALRESHLVNYWDYHGSFVSWPKETYDIAKGMRRQGFEKLAKQLENRLMNLTLRSRSYPEFVYVDEWGRVMASSPSSHEHGEITVIDSTNNPETIQAWTVSAVIAIINSRAANKIKIAAKPPRRKEWQIRLERQIMRYIPRVNLHITPWMLATKYPHYPYKVVKGNSANSTDMPAR